MTHFKIATICASLVVSGNDAAVFLLSLPTHVYFAPHFIGFSLSRAQRAGDHFQLLQARPRLPLLLSTAHFSSVESHNTADVSLSEVGLAVDYGGIGYSSLAQIQ